jgi:hypothetical protein
MIQILCGKLLPGNVYCIRQNHHDGGCAWLATDILAHELHPSGMDQQHASKDRAESSNQRQSAESAKAIADRVCPMCGREAKKRPLSGKLRYPHKCPHGKPCAQGNPLVGTHSFLPVHSNNCTECRAEQTAHPRGFGR